MRLKDILAERRRKALCANQGEQGNQDNVSESASERYIPVYASNPVGEFDYDGEEF